MKIFIICSKAFYPQLDSVKSTLEMAGHEVILPIHHDNPGSEVQAWSLGKESHEIFKKEVYHLSEQTILGVDAVLCLNLEKHGQANYIGGATFLELYEAFIKNKKIYLYNDVPQGILFDEISGFAPVIIHGDLGKIL